MRKDILSERRREVRGVPRVSPWRPGDVKSGMCGQDPFILTEPDDSEPCPGTASGRGLNP